MFFDFWTLELGFSMLLLFGFFHCVIMNASLFKHCCSVVQPVLGVFSMPSGPDLYLALPDLYLSTAAAVSM